MAKILTDKELGEIIYKATHEPDIIDDEDSYLHFLEDLGTLIADHFGGERGTVSVSDENEADYMIAFHINECVPSNGGIYESYDTDITWHDEIEDERRK